MRFFKLLTIPLLAVALAGAAPPPEGGAQIPNLSGSWVLNEELSESPRDKMMEARRRAREAQGTGEEGAGPMGGPDAGPMGGPGAGPPGARRPGGDWENGRPGAGRQGGAFPGRSPDGMGRQGQGFRRDILELEISHSEPELEILYAGGRQRVVFTDLREDQSDPDRNVEEIEAGWTEAGKLVVTSLNSRGGATIETWELTEEGERLLVTTELWRASAETGMSFTRVYDRAPVEPAVAADEPAAGPPAEETAPREPSSSPTSG